MKRRPAPPARPRPLLRRRFKTRLAAEIISTRLEERGGEDASLPAFFVVPSPRYDIRLTGPELHGDIHVGLDPRWSYNEECKGNSTTMTVDFRAADRALVEALVADFGPELAETRVPCPRMEVQGHFVPGHQPNVGHFLAWAARMPSMEDHVILESAVDAGLACAFDCFDHIHAAMRALDFMRMVRMEGGIGGACEGDEIPQHLRHPTRQGLRGKAAMLVVHDGHKVSLNATIDSKPDPAGARLRIHYGWSSPLQRYLVGWVSDLPPRAQ
jgi:hypothetical protein